MAGSTRKTPLRSKQWFDNRDNPGMTALYVERYLNFGITRAELQSGKPIIGIAQTGSDLSPCNRIHVDLAERVKAGIRAKGGVPFEFPEKAGGLVHPCVVLRGFHHSRCGPWASNNDSILIPEVFNIICVR